MRLTIMIVLALLIVPFAFGWSPDPTQIFWIGDSFSPSPNYTVSLLHGSNDSGSTFIPLAVNDDGKILMVTETSDVNFTYSDYFNQYLNTTNSVVFAAVNSSDWSNVTITEAQISDLSHTIDTNESSRMNDIYEYTLSNRSNWDTAFSWGSYDGSNFTSNFDSAMSGDIAIGGNLTVEGGYDAGGITFNDGSGWFTNDLFLGGELVLVDASTLNGSIYVNQDSFYNIGNRTHKFSSMWTDTLNGDEDTLLQFSDDTINVYAGNLLMQSFVEGTQDYMEVDAPFRLKHQPSTDSTGNGFSYEGTAGESLSVGDLAYLDSDGEWYLADADAEGSAWGMLGVVMGGTCTNANSCTFLLEGIFRHDAWSWSLEGDPMFISNTGGDFTTTAPSNSGDIVRVVGYALSDDTIYFDPDGVWIEIE